MTSVDTSKLDTKIEVLRDHADEWAQLPVARKIDMLRTSRTNLGRCSKRWVDASVVGKQIDPDSPWVGEEWVSGPWALAGGIGGYIETLGAVAAGKSPSIAGVRKGPGGRLLVPVYPTNIFDRLLMSGVTIDIWMEPGVDEKYLTDHMATFYRKADPKGAVSLVLGAGNINAIAPMDALYRLLAFGEVVLLKMNPINEYLAEILAEVFEPFVSGGFLRVVRGGADVGAYLTRHPGIDAIHITGSAATHDVIVFGPGDDGRRRKLRGEPVLDKPITSELGGVGPVVVVPGPWTAADLRYQAEHVATMKFHNAGCNCIAAQVLVLAAEWELRDAFLDEIRKVFAELPQRAAYYPGTAERQSTLTAAHPAAESFGGDVPRTLITGLDPSSDDVCFSFEVFGPALAETSLPGVGAQSFLERAVAFCNDSLEGTLGATILVHPKTARELGPALDQALADLRYGAIGVNGWNAGAFLLAQSTWGAYPGHTLTDVGSGIGVVHNTFLLEKTEKAVIRQSFYPFPRSWLHGDPALLPKPPWFVTNRTADTTARRVAEFACDPGWSHIPGIFVSALRG
jgi:aldehyde dehydrogenase (NAD(P)+)